MCKSALLSAPLSVNGWGWTSGAAAKIGAVSLTLGSGGSGGVFAPSLFIGAALGGFLGGVVNGFWPDLTASPGAYALVGMGAVVGAATHAPITAIVIIFELTSDYKIILPLMISCIIATSLATRLQMSSIYTMKLKRRGVDIHQGRGVNLLKHLRVQDVMRPDTVTVSPDAHLMEMLSAIVDSTGDSLFVVDRAGSLRGTVTMDDLRPLLDNTAALHSLILAVDVMRQSYPKAHPDDRLDDVMRRLGGYHHQLPVVADGRLIGAVLPEDVIARYNAELFKRDMAESMASSFEGADRVVTLPGTRDLDLAEIPVPRELVGRSLKEIDLRRRFATNVVLARRAGDGEGRTSGRIPDGDFVFEADDTLLVLGPAEQIGKLLRG